MMRRFERLFYALALAVVLAAGNPVSAQTTSGDINGDGFVGALDLQIVLSNWGSLVTPGDTSRGDLFPDGFIGVSDLSILLINWGNGTIPTPGGDASLGMNLSEVTYYTQEWPFVDVMKISRQWVATGDNGTPFDTGQTVETDSKGWPTLNGIDAAQTLIFQGSGGNYPGGTYVCTYEGTGSISLGFDASVVSSSPGRIVFSVTPTPAGIILRITDSSPADPIKNIKVWMPGTENATSAFNTTFTQKLAPFGVIRFMDWQRTNNSNLVSWADRTTPDSASQGGHNGVALEHMIDLCNQLGADPWFCMPHQADDDFVEQFATMVRDNLAPERKVYVEWSNEVWNTMFKQSQWVTQQSGAPMFSTGWFQKWADEAANDFAIWESVFASQPSREIIRVAAGQEANVWVTRRLTDELNGQYDAVSCAAYFDHINASFNTGQSTTALADDILNHAINVTIPNKFTKFYKDHGDLARQRDQPAWTQHPAAGLRGRAALHRWWA